MKYALFIRSYQGDIQWLTYCLKSIHKFCSGWNEIVLVVPSSQIPLFQELNLTVEKLHGCAVYPNDYIGQQMTKLEAYKYTNADIITFWDSDVIAFSPTSPSDYVIDNKPIIYKTHYNELIGDQGYTWKTLTERALAEPVEFEYMRRLPLTYHRSTLENLQEYFYKVHNKTPEQYVNTISDKSFSEFNLVGAYADRFETGKYNIIDTATATLPALKAKQYWSWGSITPEIQEEINSFLNEYVSNNSQV